ncbi:elongation factor Ts [Micrococcales bacterium 31B]|nr:elongation factor Ts [Micrococcales bacterium 31B]
MANYTAADIKALREKTGAGMLDVKKALDEAEGNMEKAVEIIRVKGLKGIAKREGRSASDGLVAASIDEANGVKVGTILELNCETDFVAKGEKFVTLGNTAIAAAVASGATTAEELNAADVAEGGTFQAVIENAGATLGEKIEVRRIARVEGEVVENYMHRTNKDLPPQVGVLVATDAAGADVARDVAMHIAAYSPTFLSREDVPAEVVENERRVAEETARNEGKPEAALAKIVDGRMNGFFKENCLLDQAFAKDPKQTVGAVVNAAGATVKGFVRFKVGV